MTWRTCLFAFCLALAGGAASAAESHPPFPSRFQLHGQLQAEAPMRANERFSLRARLAPAVAGPDERTRFRMHARLQSADEAKGLCAAPGRIFGNGFEDP